VRDPGISDEELRRLTRAYLGRRTGRTPPADLEQRVTAHAFSRRTRLPLSGVMGVAAIALASVLAAALVLTFHVQPRSVGTSGSSAPTQVHIVRTPGLLVLPPVNVAISDSATAARLASDIRGLPNEPTFCIGGGGFGTSYTLTFAGPGTTTWTATIEVGGCDSIDVSNGPVLSAANAPNLWSDLGSALGLTSDEVNPAECGGPLPPGYTHCYSERSVPSS
jgi:hypothetical protein